MNANTVSNFTSSFTRKDTDSYTMKITRTFDEITGNTHVYGDNISNGNLSYQRKMNNRETQNPVSKELNNNLPLHVLDDSRTEEQSPKGYSDGGWGWFIVISSMLIHFIVAGLNRAAGILYLRFEEKFDKPAAITAWVTSLSVSLTLGVGPVAEALCNKFSYRIIVLSGGIILCVSMIISGLSPNLYILFISYGVIGGIGKSFAYGPGVVIVGKYFDKRRGIAVGLATSGVAIGAFAVPSLVELSFTLYDFLGAFIIMAGVSLQLVVCGFLLRPLSLHKRIIGFRERKKTESAAQNSYDNNVCPDVNSSADQGHVYSVTKDFKNVCNGNIHKQCIESSQNGNIHNQPVDGCQNSITEDDKPTKRKLLKCSLLCNIHFSGFNIAILLFNIAYQSSMIFLPTFSSKVGIGHFESFPVVVVGIFDGLGRIISGFFFDQKCVKPYRYLIYNSALFFLCAVSFVFPQINNVIQLGVLCGIYGLFLGTGVSQQSVVIVDILGVDNLSNGFGLLLLFQGIGTFIGPPLSGLLKDINGTYDYAFYFGGMAALTGSFILLFTSIVQKRRNKNTYDIKSPISLHRTDLS